MWKQVLVKSGLAALLFALSLGAPLTRAAPAHVGRSNPEMDRLVMQGLQVCRWATDNCRTAINHAWADLVFPRVERADLGAGGAGVPGALVENGRITGYYQIAGGPAVSPPNINGTTMVFALETDGPVARLKSGEDWRVGTVPDVRLITENTGDVPPTASIEAFVFDRSGLHAGLSLGAFDIWKTGTPRPKPEI